MDGRQLVDLGATGDLHAGDLDGRTRNFFLDTPMRDRLLLKIPVLGDLMTMLTLSKFVQNFAVLYRANIPILPCLRLCQKVSGQYDRGGGPQKLNKPWPKASAFMNRWGAIPFPNHDDSNDFGGKPPENFHVLS